MWESESELAVAGACWLCQDFISICAAIRLRDIKVNWNAWQWLWWPEPGNTAQEEHDIWTLGHWDIGTPSQRPPPGHHCWTSEARHARAGGAVSKIFNWIYHRTGKGTVHKEKIWQTYEEVNGNILKLYYESREFNTKSTFKSLFFGIIGIIFIIQIILFGKVGYEVWVLGLILKYGRVLCPLWFPQSKYPFLWLYFIYYT